MRCVLISLLLTVRGFARSRATLHLEVLAVRHQQQLLQRSRPKPLRIASGAKPRPRADLEARWRTEPATPGARSVFRCRCDPQIHRHVYFSGCLLLETEFVMQAAEDGSGGDSVAIRQSMTG